MARDGVSVDARLVAAVVAKAGGESVNVSAVCRDCGVSRETFYKYLDRFRATGRVDAFFPLSRAPIRRPAQTPGWVEDAVVRARKVLAEQGWDAGAISIHGFLLDHPGELVGPGGLAASVPSRATIHRILVRRGQVTAQPRKRPKRTSRRFTRSKAGELWQMDGTEVGLADGSEAVVIQILDDHSRLDLADYACASETGEAAWAAFSLAAAGYGLPEQQLTDNATAFNGQRRGFTATFEAKLRELGVQPITSTPNHPQTCGKNERSHRTLQKWLDARPPARDLTELQALLDTYREAYNNRRHQALNGLTPQQAWDLAEHSGPAGHPLPQPPIITHPTVSPRGAIGVDNTEIALGRRYTGHTITVFRTGDHVTIFATDHHIRSLTIDRTRRYQPLTHTPG